MATAMNIAHEDYSINTERFAKVLENFAAPISLNVSETMGQCREKDSSKSFEEMPKLRKILQFIQFYLCVFNNVVDKCSKETVIMVSDGSK